jgi:hypothetical protein
MKLRWAKLAAIVPFAFVVTMASESRAEEESATPTKPAHGVGAIVSIDPFTRLAARDGGQLSQGPSADALLLLPTQEYWNPYMGVGLGLFNARARAGVHVHPLGRSRSGPLLMAGVRAMAGFLFTDAPSPDAPATTSTSPPVTWSYTAVLGEAGLGWRVARLSNEADLYVVPTFLGGRVHYATGGGFSSARTWSGSAMFYGGTVSLAFEW